MAPLNVAVTVPLRAFELDVTLQAGSETLAIAGPSAAGKSTLLKSIAGLRRPRAGRITVNDVVWFDSQTGVNLPPEERSVGMVFQDYALFPHLTVMENIEFGGRARADEMVERFDLGPLARSRPPELSGGERQRVALARALARTPEIVLLDEPLAALDPALKNDVRAELRDTLTRLSVPTIVVTHDFQDAATLATRVAILVEGALLQEGPPSELVAAPTHPFVASFTGANVLIGEARIREDELTEVTLPTGEVVLSTDRVGGEVGAVVYPWDISLALKLPDDSALNHLAAAITSVVELGNRVRVRVGPLSAEVTLASARRLRLAVGVPVVASFKATATRLIPLGSLR
ncbi:MAG: ABC transporter ATP-binding protein [Actinomycetota bacterium]